MSRARHPNKHIEAAISYAESRGWNVISSKGHAWGRIFCPEHSQSGCIISVWSTPRVPENHAKQIVRIIDACPHIDASVQGERDDQ